MAFREMLSRDDAGQWRFTASDWPHKDSVDANIERRQKLLKQPPRVQVEAGGILLPSMLAGIVALTTRGEASSR